MKPCIICLAGIVMLLSAIPGCVKTGGEKKKDNKGIFEVAIEGNLNLNLHIEGDCADVHAVYSPLSADYNNYHSIIIQGKDNNRLISLLIYFRNLPQSPIKLDDNAFGENAWGIANYIPDINNSAFFYVTDDKNTGTCTITEYDQVNQTVSGTFQFSTQATNGGAELAGVHAGFKGTFSNVPINDITDPNNPKGPCFGTTGNNLGSGTLGTGTGGGNNGGNNGGGGNGTGTTTSTITFKNPTYTKMTITFDNTTKIADPGQSVVFSGKPGTPATGQAKTSGVTSSNTQVGLLLSWNLNETFPATGNRDVTLNVGSEYFFLKITNNSTKPINKVYVNYGLTNQTVDNVTLSNNGINYSLGYYKAFTNSNVRAENGNTYWSWSSLSLPFTINQSKTVIAN